MAKKIAFVGSSYISLEGEIPKPGTRISREFGKHDPKTYKLDNWTGHDDGNFATLIDGRNLIQELSKQNPHFKFYNVSSLGSVIDMMPERVTFTEENKRRGIASAILAFSTTLQSCAHPPPVDPSTRMR